MTTTPSVGAQRRDRGHAAITVVVVTVVLLAAVLAAIITMGDISVNRVRAQTAADAAALASVAGGLADAHRLARAHGATVVAWERGPGPDEVTVVVQLDGVSAVARASQDTD